MKHVLVTVAFATLFMGIFITLKIVNEDSPAAVTEVEIDGNSLDKFISLQNKDGSWGDKNKAIVTSEAVLMFFGEGETPASNKYGSSLRQAVKYLSSEARKIISKNQLTQSTPYVLEALAEAFAITGVKEIGGDVKYLLELIEKNNSKGWTLGNNQKSVTFNLQTVIAVKSAIRATGYVIKYEEVLNTFDYKSMSMNEKLLFIYAAANTAYESNEFDKMSLSELNLKVQDVSSRYLVSRILLEVNHKENAPWNRLQKEYFDRKMNEENLYTPEKRDLTKGLDFSEIEKSLVATSQLIKSIQVYYRYLPSSYREPVQEVEIVLEEVVELEAPSTNDNLIDESFSGIEVTPSVYGGRVSAGKSASMAKYGSSKTNDITSNNERYLPVKENSWRDPLVSPLSTFAADVDRASYSNFRRFINQGSLPPADSVRLEEFINYFTYFDAKQPENGEVFGVDFTMQSCPWEREDMLLKITLSTEHKDKQNLEDMNLVFLVDVSGSMSAENKLPMVKESLNMLVHLIDERDRISIVTYAGRESVLLDSVKGSEKLKIVETLENLESGGSTNGSGGLNKAYELAKKNFIKGGINRIILCTDGDFNVGVTSHTELMNMVKKRAESNIFLTVMGYGMGNYRDDIVEQAAAAGKGQAFYIDDLTEVRKAFLNDFSATLNTLAKDTKLQVEFNPEIIGGYKLLGYSNRVMAAEDFKNDKKAGGAVGSGHQVTVLYQLKLKASSESLTEKLKYQKVTLNGSNEMLTLKIRYKEPEGEKSKLVEYPFNGEKPDKLSADWFLASSLAMLAMKLRGEKILDKIQLKEITSKFEFLPGKDPFGELKQLKELTQKCLQLSSQQTAANQDNYEDEGLDLVK